MIPKNAYILCHEDAMWSSIKIKQLNKTKQDISLKMLQIEYWIMITYIW